MPKTIKLLVITTDDETEILEEKQVTEMGLDEETVALCFGNRAFWMWYDLKDCTFGDQQTVIREATNRDGVTDNTLLSQKRFVQAVIPGSWKKRIANEESESIMSVTESDFINLRPPGLGNAIDNTILRSWYPGASRVRNFIETWRLKHSESETTNP